MSSFDKKTKTSQTSSSSTDLTDWSKGQFESGKDAVRGVIGGFKPRDAFAGPVVADLSANEVKAREMAGNMDPRAAVNYRTFADFNPAVYVNPHEQEVVEKVNRGIDENLTKSLAANAMRATTHGAYGGSRHGVAEAEMMRTANTDKADKLGELRYRGYEDAASRFERESGNIYGADVRNSDAAYEDQYKTIDMLSKLGFDERQIDQAKMLAEKARYDEDAANEWEMFKTKLQTEMGLFGATPMLTKTNSSGTSTSKTSDPIGTLSSLAGGVGGLFSGMGAAGFLGGGASAAAGAAGAVGNSAGSILPGLVTAR